MKSKNNQIKQFVVDAFTDTIFKGNPAAVCILDQWLPEKTMMSIALENNLSETAFALKEASDYHLRWFTPDCEIDLCGHATLAAAFVILNFYQKGQNSVTFHTMSGPLTVTRNGYLYEMDFPAYPLHPVPVTEEIISAIGAAPKAAYMGRDLLCIFDDMQTILEAAPNQEKVKALDGLLLHITAPGKDTDCISRSFAPKCGVPEDPVCGSGHCHIAPYWSNRLQKQSITAFQASKRTGILYCTMKGPRVYISGKAVLFSIADLQL